MRKKKLQSQTEFWDNFKNDGVEGGESRGRMNWFFVDTFLTKPAKLASVLICTTKFKPQLQLL